ncbi:MAG: ATP-binding cassette domain-containing protein [Muribaculaceae bacterium]|nr:ATP-binding cassette domain-containing protein [Muribaculaceae bacterium]
MEPTRMTDTGEVILQLEKVNVVLEGRKILEEVDLTVHRGDFIAVSGPNGGGKTTLLRVLLGLLKPSSGHVAYFRAGREVKSLQFGYLPQKSKIDTRFPISVGDAVRSGQLTGLFKRRTEEQEARFREVVEMTEIDDILDRPVGVLSGGQLERTFLARAIVSNPEIIVFDEPLSYIDSRFKRHLYEIMEDLARETTVILVSHEMSVIKKMANRRIYVDHRLTEEVGGI